MNALLSELSAEEIRKAPNWLGTLLESGMTESEALEWALRIEAWRRFHADAPERDKIVS